MLSCEVKDYTSLAYYLVKRYFPKSLKSYEKDVVQDLLLTALNVEKHWDPASSKASKTTFITQCMKYNLFKIRKSRNIMCSNYGAGLKYIEDFKKDKGEIIKIINEKNNCSYIERVNLLDSLLSKNKDMKIIEEIINVSVVNNVNPYKVFHEVVDSKLEDMFLHYHEYSNLLNIRPKMVLNYSYVLHFRFLANEDDVKTLQEIGNIIGLTKERVRQIEFNAITMFKKNMNKLFGVSFKKDTDVCNWVYPTDIRKNKN